MSFALLEPSCVIAVPSDVQMCPYCGGGLVAQFSAWTEAEDGTWMADSIELDCVTEPELDEEAESEDVREQWDRWFANHSYMPLVHWFPAESAVEKWLHERFRFRMDSPQ